MDIYVSADDVFL